MKRPLTWDECEHWTVADHFPIRKGRKYPSKQKKDELLISGDKREEEGKIAFDRSATRSESFDSAPSLDHWNEDRTSGKNPKKKRWLRKDAEEFHGSLSGDGEGYQKKKAPSQEE
ncbi:hypothetical protein B296_00028748 [Ensete ventricosum]|uniref:Uncharacterized protein n=1 Tax=Ensete ventricosum TaxID=4639 RepID=A0A426Z330_ENSVE|nr:hypothetical protein B296_00028748 [Ensete ventricosum]